ncbi:MAG: response regulator [Candidatus Omnitrophica bacterium]|nr:response regulator [Candidatus Omnitrophota bacterium]MDE2009704.1 response regulator [Candidatus Omnitrophota bacterium]MDE2213899.1 response regulator [Candidatus Omnitrophota bacterium]MDE2231842.1 response regulator [Candidatus Omnitrophota bacterium]
MNKILIVDEKEALARQIEERLSSTGFEILYAPDGLYGFQMAKDKTPDLIITDASIPMISGYELCKAIKLDKDTQSIPIVVMTEKHRMEEAFMFLGVKDFLEKPVNMDELEKVVRNKLQFSRIMQLQRSKVLVSGNPEVLSVCEKLLKHDKYWMGCFCDNGDSCLELAARYSPDVILVDILKPGMTSDEVIRQLKTLPGLKNSVILAYYSLSGQNKDYIAVQVQMMEVQYMKILALEAGAKEYLGALNPDTFLKLINIYRREFNFII